MIGHIKADLITSGSDFLDYEWQAIHRYYGSLDLGINPAGNLRVREGRRQLPHHFITCGNQVGNTPNQIPRSSSNYLLVKVDLRISKLAYIICYMFKALKKINPKNK